MIIEGKMWPTDAPEVRANEGRSTTGRRVSTSGPRNAGSAGASLASATHRYGDAWNPGSAWSGQPVRPGIAASAGARGARIVYDFPITTAWVAIMYVLIVASTLGVSA